MVVVVAFASIPVSLLAAPPAPASEAARVDKLFAPWNTPASPGCAVAVMKDGRIVYERGYGMADLDHDVKITPTTVFHVGSISKQFTAAAILMLARDGKISLDDPVRKYVPELPDFGTPITLRHLLHHTSGLRDFEWLMAFDGWRIDTDLVTDEDILGVMSHQKELNFPPGSEFVYCNTGYMLLAQVVARVSGESFQEFTTSKLFRPLGMERTHFRAHHGEIVKHIAYAYERKNGAFELSVPSYDTVGATNLVTTVEDLARWDENFYTARVGGEQVINQLEKPEKLNDGTQLAYGAGLFVGDYRGLKALEHGGGDAGYTADMIRFPAQHFSVATLCNLASIDSMDLSHRIAEVYLAAKLSAAPSPETRPATSIQAAPKQLAAKAGIYVNPDGDLILRIEQRDGMLWADSFQGPSTQLEALSEYRFRDAAAGELDFGSDAKPDELTVKAGTKPSRYVRVPEYTPTPAQLREFAGTYRSEEIDVPYYVISENDRLILRSLKMTGAAMSPVTTDLFVTNDRRIRFTRDARGNVSGFLMSGMWSWVRNLRFGRATEP